MSVVYTTKVLAENIKMKNIRETLFVKCIFSWKKLENIYALQLKNVMKICLQKKEI